MAGSYSIISRLGSNIADALGEDGPKALTRYIGGSNRQNIPYINGYWQFVLKLPEKIYKDIAGVSIPNAQKWLLSTAEGFTPHTRNLNKADIPGQGGLGASFPTGQTINRTFTVTFREYKNLIMLKIINIWSGILDQYTGVSELSAEDWIPQSFKGTAFAILTKPIGVGNEGLTEDMIEEVFAYDGVWIESSPFDAFNQDIATNDSVQLSVTFNFDGTPLTTADGIASDAITLLKNLSGNGYIDTWNVTHDAVSGNG